MPGHCLKIVIILLLSTPLFAEGVVVDNRSREAIQVHHGGKFWATIPAGSALVWRDFDPGRYRIKLSSTSHGTQSHVVTVKRGKFTDLVFRGQHTRSVRQTSLSRPLGGTRTRNQNRKPQRRRGQLFNQVSEDTPGCSQLKQVWRTWNQSQSNNSQWIEMANTLCQSTYKQGNSVYYQNGKVATHSFGRAGATWYYPNGKVATHSAGRATASWYYPNGRIASYSIGNNGVNYFPNGRLRSW